MLNYWQCYLRIVVFTHGVLCSNIRHQLAWWIDQLLALALALNDIRGELGNATNRVSTCGLVVGGGLVVLYCSRNEEGTEKTSGSQRAAERVLRENCG